MDIKTIAISSETYKMLLEEKKRLKAKSFDDVIKKIIGEYRKIAKEIAFKKLVKLLEEEDKKWGSIEDLLKERKEIKWFRY